MARQTKRAQKYRIKLTDKHIQMIGEIKALSEKYELPFGVNDKGQIGTFPDVMFLILLEQELLELKERLGIPLMRCPECEHSVMDVDNMVKECGESYMDDMLETAKNNMKAFSRSKGKEKKE